MGKTALIFPGQGSQAEGMGKALYESYDCVRRLFDAGSCVLGYDLTELCFRTDNRALAETIRSQPAIFTVSLAAAAALEEHGVRPDGVCGFSLGEAAALTHSGALSLEDGFALIGKRAACMQEAAEESRGGMCAVLGPDAGVVERVCRETPGYVAAVNYNCPGQTVIAGEERALAAAERALLAEGARRVTRLAVSAAFHSRLMQPAADKLFGQISGMRARPAGCAVYSCMTAAEIEGVCDVAGYMRSQMVSPVRFADTVARMLEDGYTRFIECGNGRVLTGLIKRIAANCELYAVGDADSLRELLSKI